MFISFVLGALRSNYNFLLFVVDSRYRVLNLRDYRERPKENSKLYISWSFINFNPPGGSVIFTRKRKEKTYRRDPFQGKDIFLLLRIGCYHGAKLFANYTRLNPPFSTFLSDGDKESSLEGTYKFLVLLSE